MTSTQDTGRTAKYNGVPGCPRVRVLTIDSANGQAWVRSDEAEPGHEEFAVPLSELSSFEEPGIYDANHVYCPECKGPAEPGSRNRISATSVEYRCADGHGFFAVAEPGEAV